MWHRCRRDGPLGRGAGELVVRVQGAVRAGDSRPVAGAGPGHHRLAAVLPGVHAGRRAQGLAGRQQVCADPGAGGPLDACLRDWL